jgi:hypothetical protein
MKRLRHEYAHYAVIGNEYWYGDCPPRLGDSFSAARTATRHAEVVDILERVAGRRQRNGQVQRSKALRRLARKIEGCRRAERCGSLACPLCARAFQRAQSAAQNQFLSVHQPECATEVKSSDLVMVTVVPLSLAYAPEDLANLDIPKKNRWLKDVLKKAELKGPIVGMADISWESGGAKSYYQLHWHLAMWTEDPRKLQRRLLRIFPPKAKYDRPVQVSKPFNLGFLPYMNKVIKLPDLLRRNRHGLPELLAALDRVQPLNLMVLCGLRLSAQSGRLALRPLATKAT